MAPPKKSQPAESDGEDFSDVQASSDGSTDVQEVEIGDDILAWVCPTLGQSGGRTEFDSVGGHVYTKFYTHNLY